MGEAVLEPDPAVADTRVRGLWPRGVDDPLWALAALMTASLLITGVSVGWGESLPSDVCLSAFAGEEVGCITGFG